MSVGVEALVTSALGLQLPWVVQDVKLDTAKRRIDFEIDCQGKTLACPACNAPAQPVHDRLRRSWRHLDFFQFEAWLHCGVPRIACASAMCAVVRFMAQRVSLWRPTGSRSANAASTSAADSCAAASRRLAFSARETC